MPSLEGLNILEIGHFIAAPFCAQLLGDMGANIIKIEKPRVGETARTRPPYHKGTSLYFLAYNRNKKGVTLNYRDPEGMEIFLNLVEKADALIINLRPGSLEKGGITREVMLERNPGFIITYMTGFGLHGPYKDKPALDMVIQAMSGLMETTGWPDSPPVKTGVAMADYLAGIYAALATVVAIRDREKTGKGQVIDVSMFDCALSTLEWNFTRYMLSGTEPVRVGNRRETSSPSNIYRCSDGWVLLAANSDGLWDRLAKFIGKAHLLEEEKYATNPLRVKYHDELDEYITEWTSSRTIKEVTRLMDEAGIPCGPVNKIPDIYEDPHVKAREMLVDVDCPPFGRVPLLGCPIKFESGIREKFFHPPLLGEHNKEIYGSLLGIPNNELDRLMTKGVI